jgi:dTDP-4-amino-4,6-dideoxygalactose transaminase
MTDLQGAVARAQLGKLDGVVARRRRAAEGLTERLRDLPGLALPAPAADATHVYWRYPLTVDPTVVAGGADALGARLKACGIACAPRYIQKPAFACRVFSERATYGRSRCPYSCRERSGGGAVVYDPADYPGTRRGLERVVVLPWNEFYTSAHVDFIAAAVRESLADLTQPKPARRRMRPSMQIPNAERVTRA